MRRAGFIPIILATCSVVRAGSIRQTTVFRSGEGGYSTYRIPAIIATPKGTLLAFCEGRRNSSSDTGDIDTLLRRSRDNGKTWLPVQKIADMGEDTIGNPTPVVERKTGVIWLLLTRNPGRATEADIVAGKKAGDRTVWITYSKDDGATWAEPKEITSQVKKPEWTWYATGPGNGIQLRSRRLVIPCDHNRMGPNGNLRFSHVIYSDDRGQSWKIGGIAEEKTNESAVAELKNGELVLNMRSYHDRNRRAVQRSQDGGLTWGKLELDQALIEPVCEASMISAGANRLLFSNPASTARKNMTVRESEDGGRTWTKSQVIEPGPSAYSSLVILKNKSIGLLYERGDKRAYEEIRFANFTW